MSPNSCPWSDNNNRLRHFAPDRRQRSRGFVHGRVSACSNRPPVISCVSAAIRVWVRTRGWSTTESQGGGTAWSKRSGRSPPGARGPCPEYESKTARDPSCGGGEGQKEARELNDRRRHSS